MGMGIENLDRDGRLALALLREQPHLVEDARMNAPLGNSVAGSVLTLMRTIPARQLAEAAVLRALDVLAAEAEK